MNEPKKRGRPSRADVAARNVAVDGADIDAKLDAAFQAIPATTPAIEAAEASSLAQAYALRVWRGQSPSADRAWRVERVRLALEGQGLSFEGVELPA